MRPQSRCTQPCIWLAIWVLVAAAVSGCAGRRPLAAAPAVTAASTSDIESLIERGCFRCLEQGLALADERKQPQLAFEASALLVLRATELGMPADPWMDRVRALATGNPMWTPHLEMVAAIPPDALRGLRDDLLVQTQGRSRARSQLPAWYELLKTGSLSTVFRRYLEIALRCGLELPPQRERVSALVPDLPDVPLIKYRVGLCDRDFKAELTAAQRDVPAFVDADYALGRYALQDSAAPDPDEAMRRFRSAAAAFPSSTSIPTAIGNLYQTWEEWASALAAYDTALALLPSHPDALIGRVISLSHLERHEDAITGATRLIEGGQWHLGQAFYWRAWNYFNLGNNASARADADRTRTLMVNAPVFVLSGMIEWRFRHLEPAETEFQEALKMDFGQCEAAFYLGGVRSEQRRLPEAIAAMNQARQCYDLALAVRRKAFDAMLAGPGSPESKSRESARHERAIAIVQKRQGETLEALERLQKAQSAVGPEGPISRQTPQGR
jgi:tetratricopeptide (TPR) repeat protein